MIEFVVHPSRSGFNLSATVDTNMICFQYISLDFISRMINATKDKCVQIELSNNQANKLKSMIKCE
jgi:hypothetical protein